MKNKRLPHLLCTAALLSSCSLAAQLRSGGTTSEADPTAVANTAPTASGGPPQVSIEPGKAPPWCGDYAANKNDSAFHWLKTEEGWHRKNLNYAARAACDVIDDERASLVQEWKASYMTQYSASESDFVAAMTLNMDDKAVRDGHDAFCDALTLSSEAGPKDTALHMAKRYALGCERSAPSNQLYWLDLPEVSELQRAALVRDCLGAKTEPTAFAACGADLSKLNRQRLDKELAAEDLPEVVRVFAIEFHGEAARRGRALLTELEAKAEKDESYAALLSAHAEAVKNWHSTYERNKASFAAAWEMEQIGSDMNRKQAKGCGEKLRPLLQDRLKRVAKGKSFDSLADAKAVALDEVAYPLATALVICDAMEERFHEALQGANFVKQTNPKRGPRYAGYAAFLSAFNDIREDRPRFVLGDALSFPTIPQEVVTPIFVAMTFNKVRQGRTEGLIKKISKKGDMATIAFEKVKYRAVEEYGCKKSSRISRINADGTVEYQLNCKQRFVDKVSQTEPVNVPRAFVNGLEKGQMVVFFLDSNTGLPEEVYASKEKKQLIGLLGAVWN